MKKVTILAQLNSFLDVLDARANIEIFKTVDNTGKQELLRSTKVYNLLGDSEFLGNYGFYKVKRLNVGWRVVSVLIEEV